MKTIHPISWRIQGLRIVLALLLAIILGISFNALRPDPLPVRTLPASHTFSAESGISLDQAHNLHNSGQALFVDARDALTYAQGHIQGALSLPVEDFSFLFPALRSQLAAQSLILYCDGASCTLSQELRHLLRAQGLTDIYELHDGWTAWSQAGLPTTVGEQP